MNTNLKAICRIPTFRQRITLRIMLFMGVADAIQTAIHLFTGFVVVFEKPIPQNLNLILGILIETAWESMMFLQLFLASNRLWIIMQTNISQENDVKYFDTPIVLSYLLSFLYTFAYWKGGRYLHFDIDFMGWTGIGTDSKIVTFLANGETFFMSFGGFLCIITALILIYRRSHVGSMELRLFAQTCLIYFLSISNIILWNLDWNGRVKVQALLNFEWILICILPPYLNLIMSSEIRRSLWRVFKAKKVSKVHTQAGTMITRTKRMSVARVAIRNQTVQIWMVTVESNGGRTY
ncbi:hypothetical protein M3Y98_00695300 [Aphelenchoides besseyi]|nr:hypothetical protein M3Y98_00695300 [Aphelenchoides besseyi]